MLYETPMHNLQLAPRQQILDQLLPSATKHALRIEQGERQGQKRAGGVSTEPEQKRMTSSCRSCSSTARAPPRNLPALSRAMSAPDVAQHMRALELEVPTLSAIQSERNEMSPQVNFRSRSCTKLTITDSCAHRQHRESRLGVGELTRMARTSLRASAVSYKHVKDSSPGRVESPVEGHIRPQGLPRLRIAWYHHKLRQCRTSPTASVGRCRIEPRNAQDPIRWCPPSHLHLSYSLHPSSRSPNLNPDNRAAILVCSRNGFRLLEWRAMTVASSSQQQYQCRTLPPRPTLINEKCSGDVYKGGISSDYRSKSQCFCHSEC
eukprot:386532-Rhodomonas_salina.1